MHKENFLAGQSTFDFLALGPKKSKNPSLLEKVCNAVRAAVSNRIHEKGASFNHGLEIPIIIDRKMNECGVPKTHQMAFLPAIEEQVKSNFPKLFETKKPKSLVKFPLSPEVERLLRENNKRPLE